MKTLTPPTLSFLKFSFVLILGFSFNASGTNYYVNDNSTTGDVFCSVVGNNANNGTSSATPKATFSNISATYGAILTSGDTVFIDAGTYFTDEGFTLPASKPGLTFVGAGYDLTIFDNLLAGTATNFFMYVQASNTTFTNMSFTGYENNGTQTPGHSGQAITIGGSSGSPVAGVLFENVSFYNNGASGGNPALSVLSYAEVTIRGGGSYCNSPGTAYTGGVELFGSNNTLNIEDYILSNNDKTGFDGGGLRIEGANTSFVNVSNTRISNNRANEGGAISQRNGTLTMTDCIIDGNSTVNSGTHYGAGYRVHAGTASFSRCIFSNNTGGGSSCRGGAIGARYSSTGGFSANKVINVTIDSCVFENNSPGTRGRDIYGADGFSNNCNITATDCQFLTGGNYNIYSDGSSPANSITVTYFGTLPTRSGTVSRSLSSNTIYTADPTPPNFTGVCGSIVVLSVDLVSFTADCDGDNIDIQWATISEVDNDYFSVEKSLDGIEFQEIENVNGSGNSTELNYYSISDRKLNNAPVYYRLIQVDFDGERTVSQSIVVGESCLNEEEIELIANLSNNTILVHYDLSKSTLTTLNIIDLKGQIIFTEDVFLSKNKRIYQSSVFASLQSGLYFIQLVGEEITPVSRKFLVVN